jgi:hypothetical protein
MGHELDGTGSDGPGAAPSEGVMESGEGAGDRMGILSSWSAHARQVLAGRQSNDLEEAPSSSHSGDDPASELNKPRRMTWDAICRSERFRGRWVALDECRYDEETGRATEGTVIDVDDDLVELCARICASSRTNCAILFCGEDGQQSPKH